MHFIRLFQYSLEECIRKTLPYFSFLYKATADNKTGFHYNALSKKNNKQ